VHDTDTEKNELVTARPWIVLTTTFDVEAWIDNYNRDLQRAIEKKNAAGYGICFCLAHGGEIFMHTTSEGDVVLDVTAEAEWVTPLIAAATQVEAPRRQIWALPGHTLTQLVLGLSSLIASTRIVLSHDFKMKKY
jgi:hypothetical protein